MAVCDFNMMFTYVVTGWEGSAHDSRVLNSIIDDPNYGFPHPPPGISIFLTYYSVLHPLLRPCNSNKMSDIIIGKYYLVDAGYPNRDGFLAPHSEWLTIFLITAVTEGGHKSCLITDMLHSAMLSREPLVF